MTLSRMFISGSEHLGRQTELYGWPSPAEVHDEPDDEQNQEDEEQDFSDPGGRERNASEAQNSRNDRNDEEDQRVAQHPTLLFYGLISPIPVVFPRNLV